MRHRPLIRAICILGCVLLAACGGGAGSSSQLPPQNVVKPQSNHVVVAATGDSEDEVRSSIAAGQAAGQTVRYVSVQSRSQTHVFSPYALVARSDATLIVVAYSRAYVWPLSDIHVSYAGSPVDIASLPNAALPRVDAAIRAGASKERVVSAAARIAYCFDCARVIDQHNRLVAYLAQIGLQDAWQFHPDYVPIQSTASTSNRVHTDFIQNYGRNPSCYSRSCYPSTSNGGGGGAPPHATRACVNQNPTTTQPTLATYSVATNGATLALTVFGAATEFSTNTSVTFFNSSGSGVSMTGPDNNKIFNNLPPHSITVVISFVPNVNILFTRTSGNFSETEEGQLNYSGTMQSHC